MRKFIISYIFIVLSSLFPVTEASAAQLNDRQALLGLHQAKAIFLVNVRNPMAVEHLMKVIGLTRRQFLSQKVTPIS